MSRSTGARARRRARRWLAAALTTLLVPGCLGTPATARPAAPTGLRQVDGDARVDARLRFAPPVAGEVVDGWRPPSTPYGPGNRGWEYDTTPGEAVSAAGNGVVTFAGQVGGSDAVTVAHVGGLETTYSYLDAVDVVNGQHVALGARVGSAGEVMHFGVRLAGAYVDPAVLFTPGALRLGARLLRSDLARSPTAEAPRRSATLTPRPAHG